MQILRPRLGHGSDVGGRRTPWIIGGMAALALGAVLAALAIALLDDATALGGSRSPIVAFLLIGVGVGAAGTSLLVLLAKRVERARRAAAATDRVADDDRRLRRDHDRGRASCSIRSRRRACWP